MALLHTRSLASLAAATALMGFVAALSPTANAAPKASSSVADDTPVRVTPKGEIADELAGEDEEEAGAAKTRDAYYWSPLLTNNPNAVGSPLQPSTKGVPGTSNLSAVGGTWNGGVHYDVALGTASAAGSTITLVK